MLTLFRKKPPHRSHLRYFAHHLLSVTGVVLIWRGIWIMLDMLDVWLFKGGHFLTALAGVIVGTVIIYLPDQDLREIEEH